MQQAHLRYAEHCTLYTTLNEVGKKLSQLNEVAL